MEKTNQMLSAKVVHVILLATVLPAPFTTASAGDPTGIATGTITSANDPFASAGQKAAFQAMADLCTLSSSGASFACSLTGGGVFTAAGPADGNALLLQQLSPQSAMQAESIAITSPYQFIRGVNQQTQKMRDCEFQDDPNKSRSECHNKSGGGSSSDIYSFIGPFGISFSGGGGFGDRDNSVGQTGFKIDTHQANLIIDYPFTRDVVGGFSFGYLNTERKMGLDSGSLSSDSYRFAPFLSYSPAPNSYITAMGGYALVNFDSTRNVSPVNNTANFVENNVPMTRDVTLSFSDATAKYDADQFFASLGGGYTHSMGAWSLRGYGRADYSNTHIAGFQENGAFAGDVSYTNKISGQSILSVTSTLGAELSYAFSSSMLPAVVIPNLHVEWVHEFKNSARQTQTTFNATKVGAYSVSSLQSIAVAGPERNWGNIGAGVQLLFPHAIVGFLNYETLLIDNASNQMVSGGIRVNF